MGRRKRKRPRKRLPKRILIIKNQDKAFHERWRKGRDEMDFPHPARILFTGVPNSGKSLMVKNTLLRQNPPFDRIICVHCSPHMTHEYDDCDFEMRGDLPDKDEIDPDEKNLIILEDLNFKDMNKTDKAKLNRLMGMWSTHHSISVYTTTQDFFELPRLCKRCSNVFVLWKGVDMTSMKQVARRVGLTCEELFSLFALCKDPHDSIWIDKTEHTPYPLRLNGYTIINKRANPQGTLAIKDKEPFRHAHRMI